MSDLLRRSDRLVHRIPPPETPGVRGLLMLAVWVVVVAGLYLGRDVLIPITLAVLLSFLLAPLANLLGRLHLGRVPSALLSVATALGIVLAVSGLIGTEVASLAREMPRYETAVQRKLSAFQELMIDPLSAARRSVEREVQRLVQRPESKPAPLARAIQAPAQIPPGVQQFRSATVALAARLVSPVLSPLATAGIIIIVTIFVLLQRDDLRDRLLRLFGSNDLHRSTIAMNDAADRLSHYFLTQFGINTTFGVIIGVGLFIIGIPSALLWGVLAALLRFIPYVGSPLAAVFPIVLAAAIEPGWGKTIWTAALFLAVELVTGQFVEPVMYGRSTGLSPLSLIVAAIFWTWLWGPIGLILSTPLSLCLVVLGRHVEQLEFLEVLLGDRPALTPVESFYQRALAGDAEEAREQAQSSLNELTLSTYYDEVVLKALRIAANDIRRGVMTAANIDRIHDVILDLVEDLEGYDDASPDRGIREAPLRGPEDDVPREIAPEPDSPGLVTRLGEWGGESPVLCVAARTALDEPILTILAQLLRKHGIGARVVSAEAVDHSLIDRLDTTGVALVCVSYLDSSGTMAPLRHLLRRLRQRMPAVPIIAGLWSPGEPLLEARRQRAAGADHCVTSLEGAVQACIDARDGNPRA